MWVVRMKGRDERLDLIDPKLTEKERWRRSVSSWDES